MERQKLFLLLLASFIVGVMTVALVSVSIMNRPIMKSNVPEQQKSIATDKAEEKPKEEEENLLTYQNRQFGFQFEYSARYSLNENYPPISKTKNYFFPKSEAEIVKLTLQGHGKQDYPDYTNNIVWGYVAIYSIPPSKTLNVLNELIAHDKKAQTGRENWCKKYEVNDTPDEFAMCAYYGGGWNYSQVDFAGAKAILADFRGEGETESILIMAEKGLLFKGDFSKLQDSFNFIDYDRQVKDGVIKYVFTCPANWTCDQMDQELARAYNHAYWNNTRDYYLQGPQQGSAVLTLLSTTTFEVEKFLHSKQESEMEQTKSYNNTLAACLKIASKSDCEREYVSSIYMPSAWKEIKIDGRGAWYIKDRSSDADYKNEQVQVYIPSAGVAINIETRDFRLTDDLEKKLFRDATLK